MACGFALFECYSHQEEGFKSLKWVKSCSKTFMTCQTVYLSSRGNVMIVKNRHWGRWMKDLFSSNSIPKTWLTFLVTCSFSILASQFFRSSSCSPSPVQCVVNHSWAQLLPKKKKSSTTAFESEEFRSMVWTPRHPNSNGGSQDRKRSLQLKTWK